jgi:hypothetical protein
MMRLLRKKSGNRVFRAPSANPDRGFLTKEPRFSPQLGGKATHLLVSLFR